MSEAYKTMVQKGLIRDDALAAANGISVAPAAAGSAASDTKSLDGAALPPKSSCC
jgi:hypothetical protein